MSELLLDQPSPRATTAIVVGRTDGAALPDLSGCAAVLWYVDTAGAATPPPTARRDHLAVQLLEQTDASGVLPVIEKFLLRDPRHLPHLLVSRDVLERFVEGYEIVIDAIHAAFESARRIRITRQEEGYLWQKQLLLNLLELVRRRVPAEWGGALRGLPAFVCGAGPSLDVSVAALARVADHGIVFAADSALRTLARHGLQADFAVSVDATKPPQKCLASDVEPARVVLAGISPPAWREMEAPFRRYFLSGRSLTEDWLASLGVARTAVTVVENCGSTALELAHFLGCSPIHLFGMDLAADAAEPGRRHTADADPTIARGSGFAAQRSMPAVPGNYTAQVPTFLFGEWRALNERLASWPAGHVVNVNDRGARLENTTLVHPREFSCGRALRGKRTALSHLTVPEFPDAGAARAALAELGAQGAHGCREMDVLRGALRDGGPEALVRRLRAMFAHGNFARAMGTFSLKIMPHLTPPVEVDAETWSAWLDELEELCCLAEAVYEVPVA